MHCTLFFSYNFIKVYLHTIKLTHFNWIIQWLLVNLDVQASALYSFRTFLSPQYNLSCPFTVNPQPQVTPNLLSRFTYFLLFHIESYIRFFFLFSLSIIFLRSTYVVVCIDLIPSYYWVVSHCMGIAILFNHLPVDEYLSFVHFACYE